MIENFLFLEALTKFEITCLEVTTREISHLPSNWDICQEPF